MPLIHRLSWREGGKEEKATVHVHVMFKVVLTEQAVS